jgi:phosphoglycolate phosphatase
MRAGTFIFDLDGTLWDSTKVVFRAWSETVLKKGYRLTPDDMRGAMGLQIAEIGARFFPDMAPEARLTLMDKCCEYENELIRREGGELFDGVEDMLAELSKTHPLYIVSNCQDGYIQAFLAYHRLGKYFADFVFSGGRPMTKGQNIESLIKRLGLKSPVYIGDTQGDRDSAVYAGIPFVFARYGFGQTDGYEYVIDSPRELVKLAAEN